MQYPVARTLQLPIQPYEVRGYHFREKVRTRYLLFASHLGDDVLAAPDTAVQAIGDGQVVWAEIRAGSQQKRNWGGIVVIGHTHQGTQEAFFSLYGHLHNLTVHTGDTVTAGQPVGSIAPGFTPENGWWKTPHLHFSIYTGPWDNTILPGYKRPFERRTQLAWWQNPQPFIEAYTS